MRPAEYFRKIGIPLEGVSTPPSSPLMNTLSNPIARTARSGYVYFVVMRDPRNVERDLGVVKIGVTTGDVLHRVAALQTGNPYDLVLFECISTNWPRAVEHFMHRTHASDMLKPEWLQCSRDGLPALVSEARTVAERIQCRKAKEELYAGIESNGQARRASIEEFNLHREARRILKELVPARLDLRIAELRLSIASGVSGGIPGVVRTRVVPQLQRFDPKLATANFPELVQQCQMMRIQGAFRWRGVPRQTAYPERFEIKRDLEIAAEGVTKEFEIDGARIREIVRRTPQLESWHDDFLCSLRRVHTLEGDLAELQTELIVRLEEYDALDPVCSYARRAAGKLDTRAFVAAFPSESSRCQATVPAQLRKYVYPTRSY